MPAGVAYCRKKDDDLDPEQMRADMERLALIRKKRCDCICADVVGLHSHLLSTLGNAGELPSALERLSSASKPAVVHELALSAVQPRAGLDMHR